MLKKCVYFLVILAIFVSHQLHARKYDDVIASGYIEIAVYNNFPPYSYRDGQTLKGIDVELGKLIAKKLGVEARWYVFNADETLDDDLRNTIWLGHMLTRRNLGRRVADLMMRVPYDPEYVRQEDGYGYLRNENVVMMGAYHQEGWRIARDLDKTGEARTLAKFQYHPIGVEIDTIPDFYLSGFLGGRLRNQVKHYSSIFDAANALKKGELAAIMGMRSQLLWGLKNTEKPYDFSVDGLAGLDKMSWDIGLAVSHKYRQLSYAIDDIITESVQNGDIKSIFDQFGITYEKPSYY